MYVKGNTTYADAGKLLCGQNVKAYQLKGEGLTEIDCPIADLKVNNGLARWGNGNIVMAIPDAPTYKSIKTKLVKIRYDNDDQIAVMCNNDPEEVARMEAWREWASQVAKAICKQLGVPC